MRYFPLFILYFENVYSEEVTLQSDALFKLLDCGALDCEKAFGDSVNGKKKGSTITAGVDLEVMKFKIVENEVSGITNKWQKAAKKAQLMQMSDQQVAGILKSEAGKRLYGRDENTLAGLGKANEKKLYEELRWKAKLLKSHDLKMTPEEYAQLEELRQKHDPTLSESIDKLGQSVGSSIENAARSAAQAAEKGYNSVSHMADAAYKQAKTTAGKVAGMGTKVYNGVTTRATGAYNTASGVAGAAGRGIKSGAGKVATAARGAARATAGALQSAKKKADEKMTQFQDKLAAKQKEWKDADPDGQTAEWGKEQNARNKEKLEQASQKAFNAAAEMQKKMNVKRDEFGQLIKQQSAQYEAETQKILTGMQTPIEGMKMQLEPGGGVVNGEFIEEAGWEMKMNEQAAPYEWATGFDPSDDTVSSSDQMLDLLVKECYRGIAAGNKKQVDKNCMRADILTYQCQSPIDASYYIGVTFDMTEGYTPAGFRGKIIKHWCREMNKFKGQFDIPDGMHAQGVFDTKVEISVSTNENEFFNNIAGQMSSLTGEAVFSQDKEGDESSSGTSVGVTGGVSGSRTSPSGNSVSGSGTGRVGVDGGNAASEGSFDKSKTNEKIGSLERVSGQGKNKAQHMYAKMDLNVIRYEMFLREVAPQWLHEDFLDCFMMLPNSFYAPKAPQKFQDFISRYGTHYVHAAKFGGTLSVVKKKTMIDGMTISDVRKEAQEEMDSIVGQAANKHKITQVKVGAAVGGQGSASKKGGSGSAGFQASASAGFSAGLQADSESKSTENSGDVITEEEVEAAREVQRNRFRRSSTSTKVTAIGGSHQVGSLITDLYSTNFRQNLVSWLDSIPYYPKPFEPQLLPITDMMKHLIDDMVDPDCYQECIINKGDTCLKNRQHHIDCRSVFADQSELCQPQCVNVSTDATAECVLDSPRVMDCYEITEVKSRMKRKIEALKTAVTLYLTKGELYPPTHYNIAGGAAPCKTAYEFRPDADVAFEDDSETFEWDTIAPGVIEIFMNMKTAYFNFPDLSIEPNGKFFMTFNQEDRRWYTLDDIADRPIPEFSSPPVPFKDLKTIETRTYGVFERIPKSTIVGDEEYGMVRLKQGLWLEINVKNSDVYFTQRCLDAMRESPSSQVAEFIEAYEDILVAMAAGNGQTLGFINPVIETAGKTEMPCNAKWTESQMFDGANDVQQCVKVTVSAVQEYFFIIAASLVDKSSWIYLHQKQNSLCLHKLNRDLTKDEIGTCATKYAKMSTGIIPDMVEQLYFCVYRKDNLLALSVSRPSFNRQDRENAITILSHNLIQDTRLGGQLIMPRYYAVAAGETDVYVKSLFMTEIDSLECRDPFIKKAFGGSFRCALECHAECSDYGCKRPHDPTACYSCKNAKLMINQRPGKDDAVICVTNCQGSEDRKYVLGVSTTAAEVLETSISISNDPALKDADNPNQQVCRNCHPECYQNCKNGFTDENCVTTDLRCKNYEVELYDENGDRTGSRCLPTCPAGTYVVETQKTDVLTRKVCTPCETGCATCDSQESYTVYPACQNTDDTLDDYCPHPVVPKCMSCQEGFIEVILDSEKVACMDNSNYDVVCPKGYRRNGQRCEKTWRALGYQNFANGVIAAGECRSEGCEIDEGGNFLRMSTQAGFDKYLHGDGNGHYSFQLAWKVDACTVSVLEWEQAHNPLDQTANDRSITILDFKQLKCIIDDPNLANLKKISFANENFFINCPNYQTTTFDKALLISQTQFPGITLNPGGNTILGSGISF